MASSRNPLLHRVDGFSKYADVETLLVRGQEPSELPFVTIAIPTYQRVALLREAVESAITQDASGCAYEVIVVDNDPEPESETGRLMAGYDDPRLRYFRNTKNIGMFGNMNRCFEVARGQWVALLHDDDLLKPGYLAVMLEQIRRHPRAGAILANYEIVNQRSSGTTTRGAETRLSAVEPAPIKATRIRPGQSIMFNLNPYGAPTCGSAFRRDLVLAAGGFNDDCPSGDWFFLFRFNHDHPVFRTVAPLGYYRFVQNDSLKPQTVRGFVADAKRFRLENARHSMLGRVAAWVFGPEQHVRMLQDIKYLDESSDFDWHRFDDIQPFVLRPRRMKLYRLISNRYASVKRFETRLFG